MLRRGFSLLEMLLALALTSFIMLSIVAFYPKFHMGMMNIYQQNRLEQLTEQALSGLFKDLKRAGFIASSPKDIKQPAITINPSGDCIIIRYDSTISGIWRDHTNLGQRSDVFAYRYYQHNLSAQNGATHCGKAVTRWEKLFDPNEVAVLQFEAKQYRSSTKVTILVGLIRFPSIKYQATYYVRNYNV
ncbi:prepilin peptidase dependent protein B [Orbus hercynius]|uniref:Prepilin peptidase dependent protein B n=1 Tax=Orbus hercynius TaxID=593135 RepID=A0A495RHU8_9GAMM|nr:prepilin peptidase-dependent protein [Orbus hercynius]RKS87072.1 prepilin peptidase dependent protein B [Orbus hercynius]